MSNQAGLGIGDKVHNQEINEYPEDLQEEYLRLSNWVRETYRNYGRQVWVKIIDPQSVVGIWKHIRYRVRRYPTVVLEGEHTYVGWDALPEMLGHVDRLLAARREQPAAEGAA
jgi:hypothetical protein